MKKTPEGSGSEHGSFVTELGSEGTSNIPETSDQGALPLGEALEGAAPGVALRDVPLNSHSTGYTDSVNQAAFFQPQEQAPLPRNEPEIDPSLFLKNMLQNTSWKNIICFAPKAVWQIVCCCYPCRRPAGQVAPRATQASSNVGMMTTNT